MSDKPMLFSAPMVRALLEGRKTQTRRLIKWQGPKGFPHSFEHAIVDNPAGVQRLLVPYNHPDEPDLEWGENGYHRHYGPADPGDRIWVKETGWERPERTPRMLADGADTWKPYYFDADVLSEQDHADFKQWGFKRRPSIFMPRSVSRLTLHVTATRVERLQDITEEDAAAEGAYRGKASGRYADNHVAMAVAGIWFASATGWYRDLWARINGAASWASNPWVFVHTFDVERCNIAQARAA